MSTVSCRKDSDCPDVKSGRFIHCHGHEKEKYTLGPWQYGLCRDDHSHILPDSFQRIYMPGNSAAFVTGQDSEANAKLIAAAPELLEALRDTLEVALNYGIRPNTESSALIRAHNLIKRLGE